jgi:hypothetical protein
MSSRRKILLLLVLAPLALVALLVAARINPAPKDERIGVMTHFAQGWDPALVSLLAQDAIPTVRDELYWASVEAKPGVFAFPAEYGAYMAALQRHEVSPLVVLSFENPNYDDGDTPHSPEAIDAFARYAVEVLRHYGPQIKAVEIWNEYNGSFCKGPATEDRAGTYLRMLRAAYAAIKHERPDVTVVGGATSGIPLPYWEKLLEGGALTCLDALSVHPYRYDSPPEGLEGEIADLQKLVRRYNGGAARPIWVTEIGWFTKASAAPGDLAIDDAVQADFLVRAEALLLSADVGRIYWYLLRDGGDGPPMGLFHDDDQHTPRPAAQAQATLLRELRQARFVRREDTPEDLYSLLFQRPSGEWVRVLWSLTPREIPAGSYTRAVNVAGATLDSTQPLRLGVSPLFVTGPLQGLPSAPPSADTLLADSARDFAATADEETEGAWTYGAIPLASVGEGENFTAATVRLVDDWKSGWTADLLPHLALTAAEQHPSVANGVPVAAVRRWRSEVDGTVRIAGRFRCGLQGDGVGVSVAVDGAPRFRRLLGGGGGHAIAEAFDFTVPVRKGTTVDFVVDPGPGTNIDYDATAVAVTIRRQPSGPSQP